MTTSRSTAWAWTLGIVTVLLATSWAGLPSAAGSIGGNPTPQAFDTLRVGALEEPDSLNPYVGLTEASYVIWDHVYEMLVGFGIDLTPVPALAASWEVDVSRRNWTFHLQHGVTWHDGQPFTAEDVNFTFRYIWAASAGNPIGCNLLLFQSYLGDPVKHTGIDVENITVLDPYTIRVPTHQPKANILGMVVHIVPRHVWSGIACNQATHVSNLPPIGTGMYKFTSWVRGAYIQLDLNTAYWRLKPGQDYVDRIILTYYKDATALNTAFEGGTEDATDSLPADKFALIPSTVGGAASPNVGKFARDSLHFDEVGACVASDALLQEFAAHGGRNWLLTNLTVRQALQYSVDRRNLVDTVLAGLGKPGSTMIPPATPYWHYNVTTAEAYGFDLNKARDLLNDPKHDGLTLKSGQTVPGDYGQNLDPAATNNRDAFLDTNGDTIREVVDATQVVAGDDWGTSAPNSNQLAFTIAVRNYDVESQNAALRMETWWDQVGIHVTTDIVSEAKLIGITYACSEDLYIWDWSGDIDPDFLLSVMTKAQILNWQDAWYASKAYDALYLVQQNQVDLAERQQTIWEMQRILYHDAVYINMYYPYRVAVVRTDRFSGWGNWSAHPGLGLTGYENDFLMLDLRAGTGAVTNQCPTPPVLEGTPPRTAYQNVSSRFTANSTDPEADPLTWTFAWDEGNVTRSTTASGVTQAAAAYAWPETGAYNVTVTVSDGKCGSVMTSAPFQVFVIPAPAHRGWVAGTVRDDTTLAAIPGASVSATAAGLAFSTTTDATGAYNMTLAVGTYTVEASQALYAAETRTNIVVAENVTTAVNFDLGSERGWIAGTVSSSAGGPLGAATIRVSGARAYVGQSDAAGRYNVTVAPGTYSANASRTGYSVQSRSGIVVGIGQSVTVDFVLDPIAAPSPGVSPLIVAGVAILVVLAVAGVVGWSIVRRRKREDNAEGFELKPKTPGPPPE